jgi:hypothetical protein
MRSSRILLIIVAVAVATGAFATSAQAIATMPCNPAATTCHPPVITHKEYADQHPNFVGWGRLDSERCTESGISAYCAFPAPSNVQCFRAPCNVDSTMLYAYRWSGGSWHVASFASGTQVYIYPYATGWSWVWTQSTGWLATRSALAMTKSGTCYRICPMY